MGFLSSVGDFFSSIATGISSAVRGVASAVTSVATSVVQAVKVLAPVLVKLVGPQIGIAIQVIGIVIDVVAKVMNLLKPNEKVPDMGERALQAEEQGITLESCNKDFDAYMEKLRALELDPQKAATRPKTDQWLAGSLLLEKGLELKYPQMSTAAMWPIIVRNSDFFTRQRQEVYTHLALEKNIPFGESIARYFAPGDRVRVDSDTADFVWEAEKKMNPAATDNEISATLRTVSANCETQEPKA